MKSRARLIFCIPSGEGNPKILKLCWVKQLTRQSATCSKFGKCSLTVHSSGNIGGHLVFGNPALPIPENPKARHPTSVKFCTNLDDYIPIETWGSHSVFGSPATQVPENPKAEHPTPKDASADLANLLTYLDTRKPARRRLPPKFSYPRQPKDTHFVSGELNK